MTTPETAPAQPAPVSDPQPARTGTPPAARSSGRRVRCRHCGRRFMRHKRPYLASYCSRECYLADMRSRGRVVTCAHCGRRFFAQRRKPGRLPRFCSRRCYHLSRQPAVNRCQRCHRPTTNKRFCSRLCHGRWLAERSWDRYRENGLPPVVTCPLCRKRHPAAHFLLPGGQIADRCAACRKKDPGPARPQGFAARPHPCRDCGRPTSNRLYCPACLDRREHGGT